MIDFDKIREMKKHCGSDDAKRILTELEYAIQVSKVNDGIYDSVIEEAMNSLSRFYDENKTITRAAAQACEQMLLPVGPAAKKIKAYCVSHAHIDMNWMWSYAETVAITLDTFRTILKLMKEYPEFTYSQSQASTYQIAEENDPALFEEIRERVREGRWEVTASTWVEADKNMSDGESQARHILYTKQYFKEKFGLDDDALQLDFEPDTFGHNASVPEILAKGNVSYYYHCRGQEKHDIYNWRAKSGKQVLVYKEPVWYNAQITPDFILPYPELCHKNKTDFMLKVYGVGDHGGGPTRRDIEALMDIAGWPIAPTLEFSTYRAFFTALEKIRDRFPTVEGELNYVFTGCYSSQSRIKMANRTAETALYFAENVNAVTAAFCGGKNDNANFKKAWHRTLFNQFHDIITGSGVRETREYALGIFQETVGYAYAAKAAAYDRIAECIDTSGIDAEYDKNSFAEGGGVGYRGNGSFNSSFSGGFDIIPAERGNGKTRILHLINATRYKREEPVEVTLWDFPGDTGNLIIVNESGERLNHAVLESNGYWSHHYTKLLIHAVIPPFGYSTCIIREQAGAPVSIGKVMEPRLEHYEENILENEWVRAKFDTSMNLVELLDKTTGVPLIHEKSGYYKLVMQNDTCTTVMPGNAWVEGYPLCEMILNDTCGVRVISRKKWDGLRSSIEYHIPFQNSMIRTTVSLDAGARVIRYNMECEWYERFDSKNGIPTLKFSVPFSYDPTGFRYKIPFGILDRAPVNHDVPAIGFAFAAAKMPDECGSPCGVGVVTDHTYAFRGENNALELTLIRGSQFPDNCPEYGLVRQQIGITLCENNPDVFYEISSAFTFPVASFSNRSHKGTLPLTASFLTVEGDLEVSVVKLPEDSGEGLLVRVFETKGQNSTGEISFCRKIKTAECVNIMEIKEMPCSGQIAVSDQRIGIALAPNEIVTVRVVFD